MLVMTGVKNYSVGCMQAWGGEAKRAMIDPQLAKNIGSEKGTRYFAARNREHSHSGWSDYSSD